MDLGSIVPDFIKFQTQRSVISLAKTYLEQIENLQKEHNEMLDKLKKLYPEQAEAIDLVNYFTQSKFEHIRKRIFDASGNSLNSILGTLDKCEISLNGNHKYNLQSYKKHV